MLRLSFNPLEVSCDTILNGFGAFNIKAFGEPVARCFAGFTQIARLTGWNNVSRYCARAIVRSERNIVISVQDWMQVKQAWTMTTVGTSAVEIVERSLPVVLTKRIWQIAFTSATANLLKLAQVAVRRSPYLCGLTLLSYMRWVLALSSTIFFNFVRVFLLPFFNSLNCQFAAVMQFPLCGYFSAMRCVICNSTCLAVNLIAVEARSVRAKAFNRLNCFALRALFGVHMLNYSMRSLCLTK